MRRFPQVRYIWQENTGKAAAFNRAFRDSQGDLICHLDADDYWLPRKIERVTKTLAAYDAGGILHDAITSMATASTSTGARSPWKTDSRHAVFRFTMCCLCV